jgi:hypothetical protein
VSRRNNAQAVALAFLGLALGQLVRDVLDRRQALLTAQNRAREASAYLAGVLATFDALDKAEQERDQ